MASAHKRPISERLLRFVVVGGFLGAGKTTALLRLARVYAAAGKRVGIITNDQAEGLVDTETFRRAGFDTEEITQGCFCCRFDDLIEAAGRLADGNQPDVLLAEPVGSCTDLVATVINPLRELYADRFEVAPYVALLDPERAYTALTGTGRAGFSAKVTYIYKMQQQEADVVAINKVDTLSTRRLVDVTALVHRNFPKSEVIAVSARTGEGFDRLVELIGGDVPGGGSAVNVDYDQYAEGEARLGWLNATLEIEAADGFDGNRFLLDLATAMRGGMAEVGAEPAHIKMILRSQDQAVMANLVGSSRPPELTGTFGSHLADGELILNARVEVEPAVLQEQFERVVRQVALRNRVGVTVKSLESFAPERPVPTHRLERHAETPRPARPGLSA